MTEPVFIIGCIRSGTTILHRMMVEHLPECVPLDNHDFEGTRFWSAHGLPIGCPLTGARCAGMTASDLDVDRQERIRQALRRRPGQIVNKNPHLSNKIGLLQSIVPEARFVHIVRSVLSVVSSTKLHFERVSAGRNKRGVSFVHYWPDEPLPCWWAVRDPDAGVAPRSARERLRLLRDRWFRLPRADHVNRDVFSRRFPDATRYYPGEGFDRLAESWITINANILRQVDALGLHEQHIVVTYESLVADPRSVLEQLAHFCGISDGPGRDVPQTLDTSRQHAWRKALSTEQVEAVAAVERRFDQDVAVLRESVPRHLFCATGAGSPGSQRERFDLKPDTGLCRKDS